MATSAGMHCKVTPKECCGPQECCGGALGVATGGGHPFCYGWPVDEGMTFTVTEQDGHEWEGSMAYVGAMSAVQAMKYGCLHPNCICPDEINTGKCILTSAAAGSTPIWMRHIENADDCQRLGNCIVDNFPVKINPAECECREGRWSTEWVPESFDDECINCDAASLDKMKNADGQWEYSQDCLEAGAPADENGTKCCADEDVPECAGCPHTCNVFAGGTNLFCGPPVVYGLGDNPGNGVGIVIPWHVTLACVRPGPVDGHALPTPDYGVWVATVTAYRPDCESIMGEEQCFERQFVAIGEGVDASSYNLQNAGIGVVDDDGVFQSPVQTDGTIQDNYKMEIVSCGEAGKLSFKIEMSDFRENSCEFSCTCRCPCDEKITTVGGGEKCNCSPNEPSPNTGTNEDCPYIPDIECVQDSQNPPECDAACFEADELCPAWEAERKNKSLEYLTENYCLDSDGPDDGFDPPKPDLKGSQFKHDGTVCCEVCSPYCEDSCVCEHMACLTGTPDPCGEISFFNESGHGAVDDDQYSPAREVIPCPHSHGGQAYNDPCKDRCKFNCGCMKNNDPDLVTIIIEADLPEIAGCDLSMKAPDSYGCTNTAYPEDCNGPLPGPFYGEGVRCANPWDLTPGREGSVYPQPDWGYQCVKPGGSSNGPDNWDFPAKGGGCLGCSPHHFGKFPWHNPDGECCYKHPMYSGELGGPVTPEHGPIGECNPYCEGWWETVMDCNRAFELDVCLAREIPGHDDPVPCYHECYEQAYAAGAVSSPFDYLGGTKAPECHPEDKGDGTGCDGKWPGFFPFLYYHPPEDLYCPYGEYFPANGCPPVANSPRAKKFGDAQLYYPGNLNTKWTSCCGNQPAGCRCVYPCGHPMYDPWARTEALVSGSICDVCWECMAHAKAGRPNSSLDEANGCPDGCEAAGGAGSGQCVQVVQDGGNEVAGCGQFMQDLPGICEHPRYCPEGLIPYSTYGGGYCIEGDSCCTCCPGSYRDSASGAPVELKNWERLCMAVCMLEPCGMGHGSLVEEPGPDGPVLVATNPALASVTFMRDGTSTPLGPVVRLEDKMDRYEIHAMSADPNGHVIITLILQESQDSHTFINGDEIWIGSFPMDDGTMVGSDVELPNDINGLWVVDTGTAAEIATGVIDPTKQIFIKHIGAGRKDLTGSWTTGGTVFPWKQSDSDYNSVHLDGNGEYTDPSNTPGDGSSINIYTKTKPGYINTDLFIGLIEEAFGEWSRILDKLFSTETTSVGGQDIAFSHDLLARFINMGYENPESRDVPSKEGVVYNSPEWKDFYDAPEFGRCIDHQGNPVDADSQSECIPYGGCYKAGCSANDKRTFAITGRLPHDIEYDNYKDCVEASVSYCLERDNTATPPEYINKEITSEADCAGEWITKKGEWSIDYGIGSGLFNPSPDFVYPCVPKSGEDNACRSCDVGIHIECNVCMEGGAFVDAASRADCIAIGGTWTMLPKATNSYVPSTCCQQMEEIYGQCAGDYNMDGDIDLLDLPGDQCNAGESGWCVDKQNFDNLYWDSESCRNCGGKTGCEDGESADIGECLSSYTIGNQTQVGFPDGVLNRVVETILSSQLNKTDTVVNVDNSAAFSAGDWIYVGDPGEEMLITSIDTAADRLTVQRPTLIDARNVYPLHEHVYINTVKSETGCNNSGYCLSKKDAYVGNGPCLVCNDESGKAYSRPYNDRTGNYVTVTLYQNVAPSNATYVEDIDVILVNFIEPGDATYTPMFDVGDFISICTEVFKVIDFDPFTTISGAPPSARKVKLRRGMRDSERARHDSGDVVREEYASTCDQAACVGVTGTAASWKAFQYFVQMPGGFAAGEWRKAAWHPSFKWHYNKWEVNSKINKAYHGKTGPLCPNFPEEEQCCPRTGTIRVGMVNIDNCRDDSCGDCWDTTNNPATLLKGICTRTKEGPAGTVVVTEDHNAKKTDWNCIHNTPGSPSCDGCIDKNCYHSSSGTVDCYSGICFDANNNVVETYLDGNNHRQRMTEFACVNSAMIGLGSQYQWVEYSWAPWTKDSCGEHGDYKWKVPDLLPYLASGDFLGCHMEDGYAYCMRQTNDGMWVHCVPPRAYNRGYNPLPVMDFDNFDEHCCGENDVGTYCDGFISTRRDLGTGGADTDWIVNGGTPPDNPASDVDQSPCICIEAGKNGIAGDLYINSLVDWRPDYIPESKDKGAFSIKRVLMHEIGHILGLSDKTGGSKDIMTPIHGADDSFNDIASYENTYEQLVELYDKKWWGRGGLADYFPRSGVYCGRF
tara:strand:+ start:98 stop:6865 length:6768 start_codon:yes stop_codon:yes gene_type:complete